MVEQKGFTLLIEAMRIVARKAPDWRLFLYGRGPQLEELRTAVRHASLQRHVILLGRTSHPIAALAEGDIFVIPSVYEGWGLTLTEAMSIGLPSIGFSDCSGVNWLLRDPAHGHLVAERTPAALAAAILQMVRDRGLRIRLGQAGRAHVAQFSPARVYAIWEDIISRTMA